MKFDDELQPNVKLIEGNCSWSSRGCNWLGKILTGATGMRDGGGGRRWGRGSHVVDGAPEMVKLGGGEEMRVRVLLFVGKAGERSGRGRDGYYGKVTGSILETIETTMN